MGVVYKAEDKRLHRTVALKFLPLDRDSAGPDALRFEHEAQAAASLQHPNIATIFEFDEFEDPSSHTTKTFIAMEYVEGTTLAEIIKRGPLPLNQVESIARQLISALERAHKQNLVHRDLKPGNIMVMPDGVVKILDFGLAIYPALTQSSKSSTMAGTIAYMSPEQLQGSPVDQRTDIWSFGVILYEMLTGKRPFQGEFGPAIMYTILNDVPDPIASLRSDVSDELLRIVEKSLKKDPAKRAQSVDELDRIFNDKTVRSGSGKQALSRKRKATLLTPAIVIALSLILLVLNTVIDRPTDITLAIVRFSNETGDSLTTSWPLSIQSYLSTCVIGTEGIAVLYDEYLNDLLRSSFGAYTAAPDARLSGFLRNDVTYLITGNIFKENSQYTIQAKLLQTSDGRQVQLFTTTVTDRDNFAAGVIALAEQILAFLHTEILQSDDGDLAVWKNKRPKDWRAVQEFTTANDLILQDQDAFPRLARAIEFDSTFLAPRIWIVPSLLRLKKNDEARRQYEFLLKAKPLANSFESAMIDWVGAYLAGNYEQQALFLRRALLSSKDNRILLHNLAFVETTLGNYSAALEALEPCLRTKWRYAPMYRVAGEALLKLQNVDRAVSVLEEALENSWVDPRVYPMLAAVHRKKGNDASAGQFELRAINAYRERNLPAALAHERLSGYLADLGMLDEAESSIRKALEEDPSTALYQRQLGEILLLKGDTDGAETVGRKAVSLDSSYARAHLLLAKTLERKGDNPGAIEHYRKYLQSDSTSLDAQFTLQRLRTLER